MVLREATCIDQNTASGADTPWEAGFFSDNANDRIVLDFKFTDGAVDAELDACLQRCMQHLALQRGSEGYEPLAA